MTVVGWVSFRRRYFACRACSMTQTPLDDWAGVEKGLLTTGARRLATLAATGWSFDQASKALSEFSGIHLSDQTIRRVALAEGVAARDWLEESSTATAGVRSSRGEPEFSTDGTMVNTREGWREMRLSVFSRREAGEPVDPESFTIGSSRGVRHPSARLALASQRDSDRMGELWRATLARLGWPRGGEGVTVLADGAKWIAHQVQAILPRARRVLDVYHVSEHLHQCAAALHGEQTDAARDWAARQLTSLIRSGPVVFLWSLEQASRKEVNEAGRGAIERLVNYLRPHQEALRYADRLRRGLPVGSGQVEGACKTVVARRLKINSARWATANTEPMASLCCLHYNDQWDAYWNLRAA